MLSLSCRSSPSPQFFDEARRLAAGTAEQVRDAHDHEDSTSYDEKPVEEEEEPTIGYW